MEVDTSLNPADLLEGMELPGGWRVEEKLTPDPDTTGGSFSVGYRVVDTDGRGAFLKALDYARAFKWSDPPRALEMMTAAYNFERDMLGACRRRRMRRVVLALADGSVLVPHAPLYPVNYLIFEKAEGDLRKQLGEMVSFDLAWALRALHHASTGQRQLHDNGMAHQDLKPSNVLEFENRSFKLTDLGRGAYRGHSAPHDSSAYAGDPSYAPPELLYHEVSSDWNRRCMGCDAYLLGSLVVFFFVEAGMTALLVAELDPVHRPDSWSGTYRDALPYVRDGFSRVLGDVEHNLPSEIRTDLMQTLRELCDPDPQVRGHPKNRLGASNPYGLERYEARFDLLARKAELGLI